MNSNILGTEKISKLFIKYSVPAVFSMVIAGTQAMIDGIFLGNFVGHNALASINIVQPFMQIIIGISMILGVGSLSYIGRSLGEGKIADSQNAFKTALFSLIILGSLVGLSGVFFNREISIILGASSLLLEGVSTYIKTISFFAPLICMMLIIGFINRVIGKPELYLYGMITAVIINIGLDYLFIKTLNMGIQGAAIATGSAYVSALFIVIFPMLNKKSVINIFSGKFDSSKIFPMVYNGSSEAVISISIALTIYLFNLTFMQLAGETGVAAFTTINYISQFVTLLMFGISDGIAPILSFNYGSKNHGRLKQTLALAVKINMIIGILLFIVLFAFGQNLISVFAKGNNELISIAVGGAKVYAFAFLLIGFNIISSGYFTALGDAKTSIILSASRGIIFIVLGIKILPLLLGQTGIWLTVPVAELITFIAGLFFIKRKNITLQDENDSVIISTAS